jgi:diguanylate cyclase (GGDEF)-like protein/PAS domain S-box-containing protein
MRICAARLVTTILLLTSALLPVPAIPQDSQSVVLQLKWEHEFQFAGYYAALWQGYYREAGLDVELRSALNPEGDFVAPDRALLDGDAHFGIGGLDALLGRGQGMDFVILSPIFQRSPLAVFSLTSVPIDSLEQLSRLRIAAVSDDFMRTMIQAMFMAGGIEPSTIEFLDIETSVDSLVAGLADAIVTYEVSANFRAQELGVQINTLYPADYDINFYGDALYTTETILNADPDLVRRFVAASLRGWHYALENRGEIAERIAADLPRQVYFYDDLLGYNRYFASRIENYVHYPLVPLGHNQLERWEHAYSLMDQLDLIAEPFPIDQLVRMDSYTLSRPPSNTFWLTSGVSAVLWLALMIIVRPLHLRLLFTTPLLVIMLEQFVEARFKSTLAEEQRLQVVEQLSSIRYQLESRLTNNLSLINGLAAFIASNPDFTSQEFDTYAATVLAREPALINLAAAPDLVLQYVYPLAGNEAALGLDYTQPSAQRDAVMRVVEMGAMVIAGPVELVQGGNAFIGRAPVYVTESSGDRRFWGIVSAPISTSSIYSETDLFNPSLGLEIAIRGRDGLGPEGEIFYGAAEVFSHPRSVIMPVVIGGGSWQLAAHAYRDVSSSSPALVLIRTGGLLLGILLMAAILLRHRSLRREHAYEQLIFRNEQFLREVEAVSQVGGWRLDANGIFTEMSERCRLILGLGAVNSELSLDSACLQFTDESALLFKALIERARQHGDRFDTELLLQRHDGSELWLHIRGEMIRMASGKAELVGAIQDISKAKEADALIEYQANFDALTGLANRTLFRDRLEGALAMARRTSTKLAVLFIDLDNFKSVNDNLGHDVGDEVLVEVSRRIKSCVREVDTVARYSGDEFIVVLGNVFTESAVWRIANDIVASVGKPYVLPMQQLHCGASVGISFFPDDATDADTLIIKADQAMYEVKKSGRNGWQFYTSEMQRKSEHRHLLFNQLVAAIENRRLNVVYQPIVSLVTGKIHGCEALVRWEGEDGNVIPPDVFIPLAEESGMIITIDRFVLKSAKSFIEKLNEELDIQLWLSVNASTRLLYMRDELAQDWFHEVKKSDKLPISVEITERVLVEDAERALSVLNELSSAGVRISIDDFGTGYSGLSYLSKFPVHSLKIDRSFVDKIGKVKTEESLIETMLLMAEKLQIEVVAEGVETQEQFEFLKKIACDYAQGYFIARPMNQDKFREFVQGFL